MYVIHLNSTCNQNKSKESIFVEQRDEKEVPTKSYGCGNGIFPPSPHPLVVFGTNGGMGKKCKLFLSTQYKLSRNNVESYASAISWQISKSLHTCLRGPRTPFHKNADFLDDFSANARNEDILKLVLVCFFRVVLVEGIFISWL